jgi:hypothetical protein
VFTIDAEDWKLPPGRYRLDAMYSVDIFTRTGQQPDRFTQYSWAVELVAP